MGARLEIKKGDRFGYLSIIKEGERRYNRRTFLCICDCGNELTTTLNLLVVGKTKSCGCLQKKIAARLKNLSKHNLSVNPDGTKTRLYIIWCSMRARCLQKNHTHYNKYGGRGIILCSPWKDNYENFYTWALNNGYSDELTIDRINNDGNYEPENCRWATSKEQANNRSNNRILIINGESKNLTQVAFENNLTIGCLWRRLKYGKTIEEAIK